jgi:hypothetical protein
VDADDGTIDIRDAGHQRRDPFVHFGRCRISHGIGDVDGGGTGIDGRFDDVAKEIDFGSGGIFRREFDIIAITGSSSHPRDGAGDDLLLRHSQFEFAVDGRGGEEDVNARGFGSLERFPGAIDILIVAPSQPTDARSPNRLGDRPHRFEIAWGSDRETCLDHIDPQVHQGLSDLQLFGEVHAATGRLFAIAQCGIKNADGGFG